jgi:PAS domain S-box-containing protein
MIDLKTTIPESYEYLKSPIPPGNIARGAKFAMSEWIKNLPCAMTICDLQGIVLEMNDKAAETFQAFGGSSLIGKSLMDCHPEPARSKLQQLLESGESNVYTIEKNGIRKLIYQSPMYSNNQRSGMVELVIEIPAEMPHYIR